MHAVLSRDSTQRLIALKVPTVDSKVLERTLFGPGNANLEAQCNLLALRYSDSTGRENPLVVKYGWNGRQFEIVAVEKSKPYPMGYNCSKAEENTEQAICNVASLAELDRRMGALYRKRLVELSTSDKTTLREEQRKWLAARDAACPVNDKWFVDCLEGNYRQRIAQLVKMASPTKAAQKQFRVTSY